MRTSRPTTVKEDYLRAIFRLQEKGGHPIRSVDVAAQLGLSRSTISERIKEMVLQGYLTHSKYSHLKFTRRGYSIAKKLTHKHRVVEVFLHETLGIPKSQVHKEAHLLEHAMSDKVIKKLGKFLGNPTVDSHGSPIPNL